MSIVSTLQPIGDLEPIKAGWLSLENESTPFSLSWPWINNWLELVLPKTTVYCYTVYEDAHLIGMSFITVGKAKRMRNKIPVRRVFLNEFPIDRCNMVISYNGLHAIERYKAAIWKDLLVTLNNWHVRWDEFALSAILPDEQSILIEEADKSLATEIDKTFFQWCVNLSEAEDESVVIELFKRKSKQQLRQSLKEVGGLENIFIEVASDTDTALNFFQEMESLHSTKWQSVGEQGSYANSNWVHFHERIIRSLRATDELYMARVSANNQMLGYLYGHIRNNTLYMHQTGFVQSNNNKLRPGYLCHLRAMQDAKQRGLAVYDFLPDEETSYKKFFCDGIEPVYWTFLKRNRLKYKLESSLRTLLNKPSNASV